MGQLIYREVVTSMNLNDENYVYYLVGQNLKRIRKEKQITQEKLSQISMYSQGFIMNIESEQYYQTFSLGTIWQFARVLQVDIREFFKPLD